MLKLTEIAAHTVGIDDQLTLSYDDRQRSRLPATTDSGVAVGLFLPRGHVLRAGMVLTGAQGYRVQVNSAPEALSVVQCADTLLFARACYHLGNRHVALQIQPGELRYRADHVLDQMLLGLGLQVTHACLAFEPESGAYQHGH